MEKKVILDSYYDLKPGQQPLAGVVCPKHQVIFYEGYIQFRTAQAGSKS